MLPLPIDHHIIPYDGLEAYLPSEWNKTIVDRSGREYKNIYNMYELTYPGIIIFIHVGQFVDLTENLENIIWVDLSYVDDSGSGKAHINPYRQNWRFIDPTILAPNTKINDFQSIKEALIFIGTLAEKGQIAKVVADFFPFKVKVVRCSPRAGDSTLYVDAYNDTTHKLKIDAPYVIYCVWADTERNTYLIFSNEGVQIVSEQIGTWQESFSVVFGHIDGGLSPVVFICLPSDVLNEIFIEASAAIICAVGLISDQIIIYYPRMVSSNLDFVLDVGDCVLPDVNASYNTLWTYQLTLDVYNPNVLGLLKNMLERVLDDIKALVLYLSGRSNVRHRGASINIIPITRDVIIHTQDSVYRHIKPIRAPPSKIIYEIDGSKCCVEI